jgi:hypothetical protein
LKDFIILTPTPLIKDLLSAKKKRLKKFQKILPISSKISRKKKSAEKISARWIILPTHLQLEAEMVKKNHSGGL